MKRRFHYPPPQSLSFWHFQIGGWSLMWGADLFLISFQATTPLAFFLAGMEIPLAFCLSLVLRQIYMRLNYRALPMIGLITYIGFWSLAFTIIFYGFIVALWIIGQRAGAYGMLKPIVAMSWINILTPIWFGWSSLYFGIKYWRDWDDERRRAQNATTLAQHAQLQMLQYQLNPHFLFNALNSVRALIDEDRGNAKGMITELTEFLRYSLVHRDPVNVPLREELAAIQHYLSIEKKRFEDKLQVTFDIDNQSEDYPVLSFLLHPLVENAVKYGMRTSPLPLRIRISARVQEGTLHLSVMNTGRWMNGNYENDRPDGTGTGMENVRARLENAYHNRHSLNIDEADGNVQVRIELTSENHS
jgi:two-component system LytT family sensor kinase